MRKNNLIKFIILGFVYFTFLLNVFATEQTTLSQIKILKSNDNVYTLDMGFNEEYKGKAFIQRQNEGSFFIFLPDTIINNKNIKLLYPNKDIKESVNISIDEKTFTQEEKETNYVKLTVDTADGVAIKLLSNVVEKEQPKTWTKIFNWQNGIALSLLIAAMLFVSNIIIRRREDAKPKSYTSFPKEPYKKEKTSEMPTENNYSMTNPQQKVLPKLNISKALKPTERNTFDCFELPYVEESNSDKKEFRSTLKQTSTLLQQKPAKVKLAQTSPLTVGRKNPSELMLPMIDDVIKEEKRKEEIQEINNAELLSVLNITQNKGFYLTTVEDTLALFGFINDNVFLLKKFRDLSQINLQARFYDKSGNNDLYIVRLDSYKAMIEISDTAMKELAKL